MLVLNRSQVRELLPMRDCIDAVALALAGLARGSALQPLRQVTWLPDRSGVVAAMPGYLEAPQTLGVKLISVFSHRKGSKLESHQGGVLLFDAATGTPAALLDAGAITAVRTAAATAVATDRLARPEASTLALLGSGTQAVTHLEAMRAVRPIARVRVWSRTRAHAEAFAAEQAERSGVPIEVASDPAAAAAGADIVCTLTSARRPFFDASMLAPGLHVNAVGASVPAFRELSIDVLPRVSLFTDRRESLVSEAWEYLRALELGVIAGDHPVREIGEVLVGARPGRRHAEEVTLFRSLGLAVEDLAAAGLVLRRARQAGVGTEIDLTS